MASTPISNWNSFASPSTFLSLSLYFNLPSPSTRSSPLLPHLRPHPPSIQLSSRPPASLFSPFLSFHRLLGRFSVLRSQDDRRWVTEMRQTARMARPCEPSECYVATMFSPSGTTSNRVPSPPIARVTVNECARSSSQRALTSVRFVPTNSPSSSSSSCSGLVGSSSRKFSRDTNLEAENFIFTALVRSSARSLSYTTRVRARELVSALEYERHSHARYY